MMAEQAAYAFLWRTSPECEMLWCIILEQAQHFYIFISLMTSSLPLCW
jgi:hypothetical protein